MTRMAQGRDTVHDWVGPLFLANAAACAATIVGLAFIAAVVATIALTLALAVAAARPRETIGRSTLYG
jgi:hypothetical protein